LSRRDAGGSIAVASTEIRSPCFTALAPAITRYFGWGADQASSVGGSVRRSRSHTPQRSSRGQSSGPIGPADLNVFAQEGSLFFTRPTLNIYAAKRADLLAMPKDLFEVVLSLGRGGSPKDSN